MIQRLKVLIVDDESSQRIGLAAMVSAWGMTPETAGDGNEALEKLNHFAADVILTDLNMPGLDGFGLLQRLREIGDAPPAIVLTAYGTVESAVGAMRMGAVDYLLKPVDFNDVLLKIQRATTYKEMRHTHKVITEQLAEGSTFHNLVGHSVAMGKLFEMVKKLSSVRSNVLLVGESGTGKELFARAVHYNGVTREKPFVAVNCGGIPDTLIESELFGYKRGAFTGAMRDKIGYFEAANGGTLFLDEISTLPVSVQSSLLRVLEERVVTPVGDTQPRAINVRIIAASNQDLEKMVKEGKFREDLLFRLNVVKLTLPPLRARKEDIPLLVHHFLDKYTRELNKNVTGITNGAMRALLNHEWRGNVRELENVIERAVIFAEDRQVGVEDLPFDTAGVTDDVSEDLKEALQQFERQHILYALRRHNYDKVETAKNLGIGVSSLYRKMDELIIPKTEGGDEPAPA